MATACSLLCTAYWLAKDGLALVRNRTYGVCYEQSRGLKELCISLKLPAKLLVANTAKKLIISPTSTCRRRLAHAGGGKSHRIHIIHHAWTQREKSLVDEDHLAICISFSEILLGSNAPQAIDCPQSFICPSRGEATLPFRGARAPR